MPIKLEITKTKVPVKVWSDEIESSALDQATNLADTMPIHSHMALMPDSHMGYLMPIGGVLPLVNAISVECVGVDIGCGMYAIRTDRTDIDINDLKAIYKLIRERIPVGFDHRKHAKGWEGFDRMPNLPYWNKRSRVPLSSLGLWVAAIIFWNSKREAMDSSGSCCIAGAVISDSRQPTTMPIFAKR